MSAVLVTGATGFVGGALVRHLVEGGRRVHALARPTSDRSALAGVDVAWHEGDLSDRPSIDAALAAARADDPRAAVVHNAAVIRYRTRDAALQREANVEGTRRVLEAVAAAGGGRVVHVSSIVAVGTARAGETLDEDAAFRDGRLGVDYVDTKRRAEELALSGRFDGVDAVAVCPGAIFGPGSARSNTTELLVRAATGGLPPLAPPGSLCVVGVEDVADGIVRALDRGRPGARYLLVESCRPQREVLDLAARAFGRRGPRAACPRPLWRAVVAGAAALDRLRPLEVLTPQALRLLGESYRATAARARSELGWAPEPFESVLARTAAWLRERGLVA